MRRLKPRQSAIRWHSLPWVIGAAVSVVGIALGIWALFAQALPAAYNAELGMSELGDVTVDLLVAGDSANLGDIHARLMHLEVEARPATRVLRLAGRYAAALSWLPLVDKEISAWAAQAERATSDVEAALAVLDASSGLLDAFSDAQQILSSSTQIEPMQLLRSRVLSVEASLGDALEAVRSHRDRRQPSGLGLRAPPVRRAIAVLDDVENRIVLAADLGQQVAGLLANVLEIGNQARPLIGEFRLDGQEPQSMSSEALKAALAKMGESTRAARSKADRVSELVSATHPGDTVSLQINRLVELIRALESVQRAITLSVLSLEPLLEAGQTDDSGLVGTGQRLVVALDRYAEQREHVDEAISLLVEAKGTLADLESGQNGTSFTPGLSQLTSFTGDLEAGLRLLNQVAPIGRELLAVGSVRRYLVLGHSSDEIRGTGGFVSSIWLVTLENGELSHVQYFDSARVDDLQRLVLYPKAPPGLEEHMNAGVWLMRDVSWDPDFPTVALTAQDMFRLGQRQEVDGVVGINQWTLLRLVEALGSIQNPGGGDPITPRNLLSVLEQGTDAHGRAYMDLALQAVLDTLRSPNSLGLLTRLASAIHDSLRDREMLVYLNAPELQSAMRLNGWDGRVADTESDYLYVVDSNVGWNKVDRNIERSIRYRVDLRRTDRPRASLTLGYRNHSGPGSTGCVPQWLSRDTGYGDLKNACYWDLVRVYFPQAAMLLSSTDLPLPEQSVSVEIGVGVPGADTGKVSSSHNKAVYSGVLFVGPGDRREITLVYDLPAEVVTGDEGSLRYSLLIQKQPGLRQRDVLVQLALPEGYQVVSSSQPMLDQKAPEASFAFRLSHDTRLDVVLAKETDGGD